MKTTGLLSAALALAGVARSCPTGELPTRVIANVEVVDTPLVRAAYELINIFRPLQPYLYNHLMRTWLWGAAAFNHNATLKAEQDLELHAIGCLLHDLGWDMRPNSPWHSLTNPFEVDGGLGAVAWVKENKNLWSTDWDEQRLERLYDGITLQGMASYLVGKNVQSVWVVQSIEFEFPGPRSPMIPDADYDSILGAYSNHYVYRGTNETFTFIAATKPNGTYGTILEQFGTNLVPGYNATGHHVYDIVEGGYLTEISMYANETKVTGSLLGPGAI
ncbi:hypothetical protein F5Y16DRAFT_359568 [Xylariaceae sp. FL0255]|nr:hypothetical protein F5Y16DRAFT_359568 [Xylariaceae sp. FL0255]